MKETYKSGDADNTKISKGIELDKESEENLKILVKNLSQDLENEQNLRLEAEKELKMVKGRVDELMDFLKFGNELLRSFRWELNFSLANLR